MNNIEEYVDNCLFELCDEKYKTFHQILIPTVEPDRVIGVRTPVLRRFAKEFGKTDKVGEFLALLPHRYYDADNLHAFLIEQIKDFDLCVEALDKFLPYVDNWATCDLMSPKVLAKEPDKLLVSIDRWTASGNTYEIRFGILSLMRHFLDDNFKEEYLEKVAAVKSDEYYVNMMRAWYFATALAKHWDIVLPYITERKLDVFTHNKTISKATDSYRITKEQKQLLRNLKIK